MQGVFYKKRNKMKRTGIILLALASLCTISFSQNVDDALRYSRLFYGGTARFMSMGGAFTALGGDISTLSQNPAGLGVFRSSELTITPQMFHIQTNSDFNGSASDNRYNFNLNQGGIVSNLISREGENGLISLNFGYSFNKTNNFYQNTLIRGINNNSSMADYWAGISDGIFYQDLSGSEGIAFDAWVMDTVTGTGGRSYGTVYSNYGDNPPSVYGQSVRRLITNTGFTGEHAISIGGNVSNKFYFGATIGINQIRFTSHMEHLESTNTSLASGFDSFTYIDHYEERGTGYNIKLGAIIKPVEYFRIGLAFHSPTWYRIYDYAYNDITSHFTDGEKYNSYNDPMRFNYYLSTPFRFLAGAAFQIQKLALISADYEFVDYSTARFRQAGDGYDYTDKNLALRNTLKPSSNIRIGGELRLNNLYLRTGYGNYGSAFKSDEQNSDLRYSSLSFGIGYRQQNVSIDFAYTNYNYSEDNYLYPLDSSFTPALASIKTSKNMFTLTLAYKLGY
jgi:hypothetical protein